MYKPRSLRPGRWVGLFPAASRASDLVDTNNTQADWFGSGDDSIHTTYIPDNPNPPSFGGFTQYSGTFSITGGTGHYFGATGGGLYKSLSIPEPGKQNTLKLSVFQTGEINVVPEPSTYTLLLAGAGMLAFALRRMA